MPKRRLYMLLPLAAVIALAVSLGTAGCSSGAAADGDTPATFPLYTPTSASGDAAADRTSVDSTAGSSSMTPSAAPPVASTEDVSGTALGTAVTTPSTAGATGSTITVMPTRPSVTLAQSVSVSASVPVTFGEIGNTVAERYIEILHFIDRAHAEPARDWTANIEMMFVDPYKGSFIDGLSAMNQAGLHGTGHLQASAVLTSVDNNSAALVACMDVSRSDIVDAAGNSVVVGESKSNIWKFTEHVTMANASGTWKLSSATADRSAQC